MKRRDFFKTGALAGAAAASTVTPGCGASFEFAGATGDDAFEALGARIDRSLAFLDDATVVSDFFAEAGIAARSPEALAQADAEARTVLRTLYVSGMLLDLTPEEQTHPDVQQRVWSCAEELGSTTWATVEKLRDLGADGREKLRQTLREQPELVQKLAAHVDRRAELGAMSASCRTQTQLIFRYVNDRFARQPPALLVDEYVTKAEKVRKRVAADGQLRQEVSSRIASTRLWATSIGAPAVASASAIAASGSTAQGKAITPIEQVGDEVVSTGLVLLGIALGVSILSGLALAGEIWLGVFGLTAGAVLLIAGLVVIIVGASL